MIKLQKLIDEMCPTGVPKVVIDDLIAYEQPTKYLVASKAYDDNYPTPVLTAGQTFLLGYTNEEHGKYPASQASPVIIFDDFTTAYKWVDFEFKVKSSAMKMLTPKAGAPISLRYFWYALSTIQIDTSEHARYWISKISNLEISLPPLEVQDTIVSILDKFTALEVELEEELEARKTQYDHYRNHLFSFHDAEEGEVQWVPMGEFCEMSWGNTSITKASYIDSEEGFLAYSASGPDGLLPHYEFDRQAIILSAIGARCGKTYFASGKWTCIKNTIYFYSKDSKVLDKYLFWYTNREEFWPRSTSAQPFISLGDVRNLEVPIPDLVIQQKIVDAMDKLDALISSTSIGLPAEIMARRQQYEYFRNKLLTFKKLEVS